uniref:hypothetical protein n=1 Tax=Coelastrella saipanensis TaxID=152631 RepID=UPI0010C593F0|nr:hypothetical protein [Coelastrella saipanensis]AVV61576.1 hypothetical protein [Coelastrella saipanensis]
MRTCLIVPGLRAQFHSSLTLVLPDAKGTNLLAQAFASSLSSWNFTANEPTSGCAGMLLGEIFNFSLQFRQSYPHSNIQYYKAQSKTMKKFDYLHKEKKRLAMLKIEMI